MATVSTFLKMLESGTDNALLRYSLGNAYFVEKNYELAIEHLQAALQHDRTYSAAWKILGRSYLDAEKYAEATETLEQGIAIAAEKGDKQAEKEMQVFLKRAEKNLP